MHQKPEKYCFARKEKMYEKSVKKSFFKKNQKNSKKPLQKVLCCDNMNIGHAREIKNTKQ